jgi:Ca2+-binding RTX toxin-like protein
MPLTPETWLNEFIVNLNTTGSQSDPTITQLANGNILVTWTSSDNTGVGSPAGNDLIGQIFDPMGARIGGEFLVNSGTSGDSEVDADVAGLPSGGFLSVFERGTGSFNDIILKEHDANGNVVNTVNVFFDGTSNANPNAFDPHIAVGSNTSALVVYREIEDGANSRIVGKLYNSSTNTLGPVINLIDFAGSNSDPDVTALNNGNFVVTATRNNGGDNEIIIRIINSAGGSVLGVTAIAGTSGDAANDREASVTALTGGGFVVTWTSTDANDTDIEFQVFNSAGVATTGLVTVTGNGATDNGNEPVVVALNDGGFVVIYDEDTEGNLSVERFNSSGVQVGNEFIISAGAAITSPDAKLLADGRIAVTFVTQGGEIGMEIIDIRDTPNNGVYTPDQWQIGTVGDDVFTADASSEFVHGAAGNDTITESGQIREYFGDAGNDTLIVKSSINDDLHDGGSGTDTIDWSQTTVTGATFNLATGLATASGQDEQMVSIENLIGTNNDDIIIGSSAGNVLSGGGGNDDIDGGSGQDTINGGIGNDTIRGGFSTDTINGDAGNDVIKLFEGEFGDDINGGADTDTLDLSGLTASTATVDLAAGTWNTSEAGSPVHTITSIEVVIGGGANDSIRGTGGSQTLSGGGGNDTLEGGFDGDTLNGDAGNDTLFANTAAAPTGSTVGDTMNGGTGNDAITGANGDDTITGGADADTMVGNGGADTFRLATGDGNDVSIDGGTENDRLLIQSTIAALVTNFTSIEEVEFSDTTGAANSLSVSASEINAGLAGNLVIDFAAAGFTEKFIVEMGSATALDLSAFTFVDLANADKDGIVVNGDVDAETIIGSTAKDIINGGDGNDKLTGGLAKDRLAGGDGNDTFFVDKKGEAKENAGEGIDTVKSGVAYSLGANIEKLVLTGSANINGKGNILNNSVTGNSGDNVLTGFAGNDKLFGNDGSDTLIGGLGRDKMNGGLGSDKFDFNAVTESGLTSTTRDIILGFDAGTNTTTVDRIDLSTIDAKAGIAGNQTFTFGGSFTEGHIKVAQSGSNVVISINTDGDSAAEMTIQVQNVNASDFNASDFIL